MALDWDLPASLPPVWADEGRIGQVLTNLLSNALQYTPTGGRVAVSAVRDGDQVRISVLYTGEGIPAGQLELVFERFHRVDGSRFPQSGGGSGTGLTIARSLVDAHGEAI